MKFTKTAFRKAFKEADQTLLWKLTYLKLGHTPTKGDFKDGCPSAYYMAYHKGWMASFTFLERCVRKTKEK